MKKRLKIQGFGITNNILDVISDIELLKFAKDHDEQTYNEIYRRVDKQNFSLRNALNLTTDNISGHKSRYAIISNIMQKETKNKVTCYVNSENKCIIAIIDKNVLTCSSLTRMLKRTYLSDMFDDYLTDLGIFDTHANYVELTI